MKRYRSFLVIRRTFIIKVLKYWTSMQKSVHTFTSWVLWFTRHPKILPKTINRFEQNSSAVLNLVHIKISQCNFPLGYIVFKEMWYKPGYSFFVIHVNHQIKFLLVICIKFLILGTQKSCGVSVPVKLKCYRQNNLNYARSMYPQWV